jgi:hypothetical protein
MKTWLDWCRNRAVPFSVMDFANKAVLLDPGERVINIERVRELMPNIESRDVSDPEEFADANKVWKGLKKELGLE